MQPSLVINALGYSTFSKYDLRNRKVAEYGTGAQPATFGYDDADNLTKLTTYRATGKVISTDPSGLEGDTTTWKYDLATGLELRKTYADGKGTVKTYDAYNNLATVTDARGVVASYSYNLSRGLLTGIDLSDGTPAQKFTYNFLGQVVSVQDASGARSISYGRYGSQLEEVQQIASSRFLLQEQRDAYGRGTGYILKRNGNRQCAASITYGTLGRIALAGFIHAGVEHQFRYGYLAGSNLLQSLTMPNGVTLTQSYEQKRNLLTEMLYAGTSGVLAKRSYTYDVLGRPTARGTEYPQRERKRQDVFGYNQRSELTCARLGETGYRYAYDNIGNRISTQEAAEEMTYVANDLNQYTQIDTNGNDFTPEYDADGNQTLIQTSTGIWKVQYHAQNRAIRFENESNGTVITCDYDYMGRRIWKKVENANGTVTLHQRYIYYDYLQIAALDLTRATLNGLWLLTWDPSQAVATRPLAIRKDGSFLTYGWDLTKNICETYTSDKGFLSERYTYSPFGTRSQWRGIRFNPLQWSSEVYDAELGLAYYNYRYCNPRDGRWIRKDPIGEDESLDLYQALFNSPLLYLDILGLAQIITDMTNGYTYWIPTNCCCESPQKFKSLNQVVKSAKPGANDPYESEDTRVGHTKATKKDPVAYGPNIPILTNDPRGRWLHGGGTRLGSKGSQEPYQELCPTFGCTRFHNEDVKTLGNLRKEHGKKYPKEKVPYKRDHFEKGSVLSAYTQCLEEYNSEPCQQKQNKR